MGHKFNITNIIHDPPLLVGSDNDCRTTTCTTFITVTATDIITLLLLLLLLLFPILQLSLQLPHLKKQWLLLAYIFHYDATLTLLEMLHSGAFAVLTFFILVFAPVIRLWTCYTCVIAFFSQMMSWLGVGPRLSLYSDGANSAREPWNMDFCNSMAISFKFAETWSAAK